MANGLVNMANQFSGLPMGDLIGGPLQAACDAQLTLANATAGFITQIGFYALKNPAYETEMKKEHPNKFLVPEFIPGETRTVSFDFQRYVPKPDGEPGENIAEQVSLQVPMLAIVNVPALSIKKVHITFDMEVKSAESEASSTDAKAKMSGSGSIGYPPWAGVSVSISGSVSSHQESTRSSDNSAKYHVEVLARDDGMPEGLARVMDIIQSSVAPKRIALVEPASTVKSLSPSEPLPAGG